MTFINEFISADDVIKYGIEAIDKRYGKLTYESHWTIDRERDIYLRQVAREREEFSNRSHWTFYWKGVLIALFLDEAGGQMSNGELFIHYELGRIDLPPELLNNREENLAVLKDALTVRNAGGVRTLCPVSKFTFNF